MGRKKWDPAPPAKGASSKQVGPRKDQAKNLSARSAKASHRVERVPYLNPDSFSRFIGPRNWGQALINDELTTCLLDNGAQLNFITPSYAIERGMDIMSLDRLAQEIGGHVLHIKGMGGSPVEPIEFVLMNVKVPCVWGYDEDRSPWLWMTLRCSSVQLSWAPRPCIGSWRLLKKVRSPNWLFRGPHHDSHG